MAIPPILTDNPNVIAVVFRADHHDPIERLDWHGQASWRPLLQGSLLLIEATSEPYIRVVAGDFTAIIQREGRQTYGVVIHTGDPVAKSLHRMIRRASNPSARARRPAEAVRAPDPGAFETALSLAGEAGLVTPSSC